MSEEEANSSESEEEQTPVVGQKRKLEQSAETETKKPRGENITLFVGNLPWSATEDDIRTFFGDVEIVSMRLISDRDTGNFKGFGYFDFADQETADQALALSGSDYEGRPIKVDQTQSKATGGNGRDNTAGEKSLTCFVGNLSFNTDEDAVREFLSEAGAIASVRMISDRETGQFKGLCFVQFEDQDGADAALSFHGSELDGRNVRVTYDTQKPDSGRGGRGGRGGGRGGFDRGGRGGYDRGGRGGFDRGGRGGYDRGGRGGFDRGGRGGGRGFGGGRGGDRGGRGGFDRGGRGRGAPAFAGKRVTFD